MGAAAVTAAVDAGAEVVVAGRRPLDSRPPASDPRIRPAVVDISSESVLEITGGEPLITLPPLG